MSNSHSSRVEFPTTGNESRLNSVKVTAYRDSRKQTKAILFERSAEVKQILFATQDDENINDLQIDVKIQFSDQRFMGASYGLALAIASKQARLGCTDAPKRIVATGVIGPDGAVQAVEAFDKKLLLISHSLGKDTIFIFPKANSENDKQLQAQIKKLTCQVQAIDNLAELKHLWGIQNKTVKNTTDHYSRLVFIKGILYGAGSVILFTIAFVIFQTTSGSG